MTANNDELPALSPKRTLLFLHRGTGRSAGKLAHRKYPRITNGFPRGQAGIPVSAIWTINIKVSMLIVYSQNGVPIRLTTERWRHIMQRHPEMAEQQDHVLETLAQPELIQQGDDSELLAFHFYPQTPLTSKYLVVV